MEFRFTAEQEAFRLEVREFFKSALGEGWGGTLTLSPDDCFKYSDY